MNLRSHFRLEGSNVDQDEFTRLWLIAVATYGVGDVVTTIALLRFSASVQEANVIVRTVTEMFGQPGFVVLKIAVFVACILISVNGARAGDRFLYYLPPVVVALLGAFTTSLNIRLLMG